MTIAQIEERIRKTWQENALTFKGFRIIKIRLSRDNPLSNDTLPKQQSDAIMVISQLREL